VRWLFAGLVALVASVGVALFALPDPGYVLIGFGKYSLETTLLVFVVVLAVVYVSLRMLAGLWHVPARVRRWNYRRESRRQRKLFDGAVIELVEGRPERAERRLARLAYSSETPLDIYLCWLWSAIPRLKLPSPWYRLNCSLRRHNSTRPRLH